jgi:hypothetical protein
MAEIVVAAGPNDSDFAVIDFSNPSSPRATRVNPGFGGSCVVDAKGSRAAVGNGNSDDVLLYDVSDPANPAKLGAVHTRLSGIGALSIDGSRVLAGELNGKRAALVDFSNPAAPVISSTVTTSISGIGSISLSGSRAVASGPNDFRVEIIDYSDPANPSSAAFDPGLASSLTVDLDGTNAALGAQNSPDVALLDIVSPSVLSKATTALGGIFSIKLAGVLVGAGSSNDPQVALIDFSDLANPTVASFNPGVGIGATVSRTATHLVAGAINALDVAFFGVSGSSATLLGSTKGAISSIATIAIAEFAGNPPPPPPPGKPQLQVIPSSLHLDFGSIAFCLLGTETLTLRNLGNAPLTLNSITTAPPFSTSPNPGTIQPGGTANITVTFKPGAVGPASGSLTIVSNDPTRPRVTVTLSGAGIAAPRHLAMDTSPLAFGACLINEWIAKRVRIANTSRCEALTVTSVTSDTSVFPITIDDPTTLPGTTSLGPFTVQPNGALSVVVAFGPSAPGPFQATLKIESNDPSSPRIELSLSGAGVLAKATSVALVLDRSGSMAEDVGHGTKMEALRSAVGLFADLLPVGQGDFLSAAQFNDSASAIIDYSGVDKNSAAVVKAVIFGLQPDGRTSIGAGLQLAFDQLIFNAHTPRKVLLVFTDGEENEPPFIADVEPGILNAGMEVYAIGLGSAVEIDANKLHDLAASSNGKFFSSDDALLLRKNFVQVLADAFRMNMAGDPIRTIQRGTVIDVPFEVTRCERRLRFTCAWDDQEEQLGLELIAPDGTVFTPLSEQTNQLVRFVTGAGYAFYNLALPPLDEDDVIGPRVVGTWRLRVNASDLGADQERFTAALIVDSEVSLGFNLSKAEVASISTLTIDLSHNGVPLPGADVRVLFRSPLVSAQGIRAGSFGREQPIRSEGSATGARLTRSLTNTAEGSGIANIPYRTRRLTAELSDTFQYTLDLPRYRRDGIYELVIEATAPACGGKVTRFAQVSVVPVQFLSSLFTRFVVSRLPGSGAAVKVVVMPRDQAGNLLGIGLANKLQIVPTEGMTLLRVIDRFDGSYEIQVARQHRTSGELVLTLDGRTMTICVPANPGGVKGGSGLAAVLAFLLGLATGLLVRRDRR